MCKVTFDPDAKPPNYGPMKLHTKPLKRKNKEKDIDRVIMFQAPKNNETVQNREGYSFSYISNRCYPRNCHKYSE